MSEMTTHAHPAPETVAALRAREPDAVLLFRVADGTYASYDHDAMEVNRLLGAAPGTVFYADSLSDHRWVTFPAEHLYSLLASRHVAGRRFVVCEPVGASAGPCPGCSGTGLVWYAAGGSRSCPRCLGSGRADGAGADVAERWEC